MQAVAEKGVGFVDLFNPSKAAYADSDEALTINGVHLNELGNRHIAQIAAKALLGKSVNAGKELEKL